jgi:hypothetical protein
VTTGKIAGIAFRFGWGILAAVILFFAREDPQLADLYIEVIFWITVVSVVLLGISLAVVAIAEGTED